MKQYWGNVKLLNLQRIFFPLIENLSFLRNLAYFLSRFFFAHKKRYLINLCLGKKMFGSRLVFCIRRYLPPWIAAITIIFSAFINSSIFFLSSLPIHLIIIILKREPFQFLTTLIFEQNMLKINLRRLDQTKHFDQNIKPNWIIILFCWPATWILKPFIINWR